MNRHEALRAYLMGRIKTNDLSGRTAQWVLDHKPLKQPSISSMSGRRINRFCVGSDPEFAFAGPNGRDRLEAIGAGMKVGLAAGADQNERLVELRPWPSQSVVAHVAGILTALRWMYRVYSPAYLPYQLRTGAFFAGDGMGGHVHFGRKRPTREEEVSALDGLATAVMYSGLAPKQEWMARAKGDRLGQIYGAPGDFRKQRHGYEYRALPSWLQSPTVAFICLTLSKLAVLDPEITSTWFKNPLFKNPVIAREMLRGLAKLYKARDDDAYILYHILTRMRDEVFVINHQADFAPAWGIPNVPHIGEASTILPASIEPDPSEVEEVMGHLLFQIPLTFKALKANFKTWVPRGYTWAPAKYPPHRRSGFGDLLHNLVYSNGMPLWFSHENAGPIQFRGAVVKYLTPSDRALIRELDPRADFNEAAWETENGSLIHVTKEFCQTDKIEQLRNVLIHSNLFPLWTVESVELDSLAKWQTAAKPYKQPTWRRL
jgi:hypothetical protein